MIRIIIFFIAAIVVIIASIPYMLFQLVLRLFNKEASHRSSQVFVTGFVFKIALLIAGTKVEVRGKENIPDGEPVMYVPNHRSIWDIIVTYRICKRPTAFISKDDMKKVPGINVWMWLMNCQFLDRSDLKKGAQLILRCIDLVKGGTSVTLFAEGTRRKGESELPLLEFHEGSFKIASRSGCYVQPVAIHNTRSIWEKQFPRLHSAKVIVQFGKPFKVADLSAEDKKAPGVYTRKVISDMLVELNKECGTYNGESTENEE